MTDKSHLIFKVFVPITGLVTCGFVFRYQKQKKAAQIKNETQKFIERIKLSLELWLWVLSEGWTLSEEDFLRIYEEKVEFINIVTS